MSGSWNKEKMNFCSIIVEFPLVKCFHFCPAISKTISRYKQHKHKYLPALPIARGRPGTSPCQITAFVPSLVWFFPNWESSLLGPAASSVLSTWITENKHMINQSRQPSTKHIRSSCVPLWVSKRQHHAADSKYHLPRKGKKGKKRKVPACLC